MKIRDYFDLGLFAESEEPTLGTKHQYKAQKARARRKTIWTIALYLGVILGVVGQQFLDRHGSLDGFTLIASMILGTVVFPQVYKQARLNAGNPNLMQIFIAFQNGFFWQNLMSILAKLIGNG